MTGFVIRKVLRTLFTLFLVVTFVFFVLRLTGDPVSAMMPDDTDPAILDELRKQWGLDRPLGVQYLEYWVNLLQGDFGNAFRDGRPALEIVSERIPATLKLTLTAFAFIVIAGFPLGIIAAVNRGTVLRPRHHDRLGYRVQPAELLPRHIVDIPAVRDLSPVARIRQRPVVQPHHAGHHAGHGRCGSDRAICPIINARGAQRALYQGVPGARHDGTGNHLDGRTAQRRDSHDHDHGIHDRNPDRGIDRNRDRFRVAGHRAAAHRCSHLARTGGLFKRWS